MTSFFRTLALALPLTLAALSGPSVAASGTTAPPPAASESTARAPAGLLGFQQVIDRVVAQGFRDVREVELKGDRLYEIEARDDQGRRVELTVDGRSGEILRRELKRQRHD